jgi:hypothetical protein
MSDKLQNNKALLEKADMRLADLTTSGGALVAAQARRFIRLLVKEAVLMKRSMVVPMRSRKQLIDKIRFSSRILKAGNEATALSASDRSKPNLGQVELDAQLFKAEVRLSNETLEDSIEQQNLRNTVMSIMSEAISRDMDEVLVQGDTASADPFLAQFDGLLKQANTNVANALDNTLNKKVLRTTLKAMPIEWLRNKTKMEFLTSVDAAIDYADFVADRMTGAGDDKLLRGGMGVYSGIPVIDVPLFPENIASTVGGSSELTTNVILTDPKNIQVGIWRKITIETDKDISAGELKIVASIRFDMKLVESAATVKTINVAFAGL